ncbi:hypothetical protein PR048_002049 [Dryococelus australis]|uniref:Uncharacterized protein n=1 Tax=Dryococelus australis TaxID=614101 RepID=A0ABQ9IJ25_9NEOP|nr:hypothetical protein PR048_002049 [Dryococelus australis]
MKGKACVILYDSERKASQCDERLRIVETAAEIILEDIRSKLATVIMAYVARELQLAKLSFLLAGHINLFHHCFWEWREGVYVHRHHKSKQLVKVLSKLSFSVDYKEVKRYEYSLMENTTKKNNTPGDGYVQYAFNNVDFNVRTMTGHGTFHSMGGLHFTTPPPSIPSYTIPRVMSPPPASDVFVKGKIPV